MIDKIEEQIISDIAEATKVGLKVQPGSFGSPETMRCCPMSAVALAKAGPSGITNTYIIVHNNPLAWLKDKTYFSERLVIPNVCARLDVDEDWIHGFVYGYDAMHASGKQSNSHKAGFDMGRKIRKLTFES